MSSYIERARFAARSLWRAPSFAALAIGTLALGIGLATAVFAVADATVLRQIPLRDQDELVALWGSLQKGGFDHYPLGVESARAFARQTRQLERVGFISYEGAWPATLRAGNQIAHLRRAIVSGNFFDVLDVQPALGRTLRPSDDLRGAPPVIVLSYAAWQRQFGGARDVIGRQLLSYDNAVTYTIVGVMPRGLEYPRGAEWWAPMIPSIPEAALASVGLDIVGRLAPGASPASARTELTAFFGHTATAQRGLRGVARSLPSIILGDTRPALFAFAAAAALLLLITCTNVANLLLMRGLARVREIAVRTALGAARWQILTQLAIENVVLAAAGGTLGCVVAAALVQVFSALTPVSMRGDVDINMNVVVIGGAVVISAVTMLLFGLAPAVMLSRVDLADALRSGLRHGASRRSRIAREALVSSQIALAFMVLAGAGLIAKSLMKLQSTNLSFDASRLVIGELALRFDQFDTRAKRLAMLDKLLPALAAVPGVRAVSPVLAVPFSGNGGWDGQMASEGQTLETAATNPMLNLEVVAPNYFSTLGVPVLRGRAFTDDDRQGTPDVIIVSQSTAQHYWPGVDPIGKRFHQLAPPHRTITVVGVVPDTRYRDLRDARSSVYLPLRQAVLPAVPTTLAIRVDRSATSIIPTLRRVIDQTESVVALSSAESFDDLLDAPLAQPRMNTLILAIFATSATLLAAVGLFGVMATMVRQRTREMGIRLALGATATDLRRLVLRRGMMIATVGACVGIAGSVLVNRLLSAMLYDTSPADATTLAAVASFLLIVTTVAMAAPARATTRIDPTIAMRGDG